MENNSKKKIDNSEIEMMRKDGKDGENGDWMSSCLAV